MLHPSYSDLMNVANHNVEEGEAPVVTSRYSIVMATAKRARQIIAKRKAAEQKAADQKPLEQPGEKPLSVAVDELYEGTVQILSSEEEE